jgi:hypothetical protein
LRGPDCPWCRVSWSRLGSSSCGGSRSGGFVGESNPRLRAFVTFARNPGFFAIIRVPPRALVAGRPSGTCASSVFRRLNVGEGPSLTLPQCCSSLVIGSQRFRGRPFRWNTILVPARGGSKTRAAVGCMSVELGYAHQGRGFTIVRMRCRDPPPRSCDGDFAEAGSAAVGLDDGRLDP